jgi:cation transport protein ChaC
MVNRDDKMWVFGYGSLMWANWCDGLECQSKRTGILRGYRRAFNKASTWNWGHSENPGPKLNLVSDPTSSCKGMLFQFQDNKRDAVINCLKKREGKGFKFPELTVRICLSITVSALVPIYSGNNLLQNRSPEDILDMVLLASGENGQCKDYVLNLAEKMRCLKISDSVVVELATRIRVKDTQ